MGEEREGDAEWRDRREGEKGGDTLQILRVFTGKYWVTVLLVTELRG